MFRHNPNRMMRDPATVGDQTLPSLPHSAEERRDSLLQSRAFWERDGRPCVAVIDGALFLIGRHRLAGERHYAL